LGSGSADNDGDGGEGSGTGGKKSKGKVKKTASESLKELSDVRIIWPSVATIGQCVGGYAIGDAIPCSSKQLRAEENKQLSKAYKPCLVQCLHQWDGDTPAGKQRNAPHLKTVYRYFEADDGQCELLWLYVGSHDLSMAAWGFLERVSGGQYRQLHCKSYELGVLFLPSRTRFTARKFSLTPTHYLLGYGGEAGMSTAASKPSTATPATRFLVSHDPGPLDARVVHFPLPHRVPAQEFRLALSGIDNNNTPWASDLEVNEVDCIGNTRTGSKYKKFLGSKLLPPPPPH
jgi:tyrosyl-DNA phosphodiesterase-1